MKRLLITGATSWIGGEVEAHLATFPGMYEVNRVSLRGDVWREQSWEGYDSVLHLAAAALDGPLALDQCLLVNRDLTLEVARKAKADGVSHFVFTSTMHVYGAGSPDASTGVITFDTEPIPVSPYGISKLAGESALEEVVSDDFKVAILRIPLVYGSGCSGNFALLAKLARISPLFPDVDNRRSMIYSRNLAELIRLLIEDGRGGLFLPQDRPVSTPELIALLATVQDSHIRIVSGFKPLCRFAAKRMGVARKLLGSSWYDPVVSECGFDYRRYSLEESLSLTLRDLDDMDSQK